MDVLNRNINLRIDDLSNSPEFYKMVRQYDQLLIDYMRNMSANLAVQMTNSPIVMAT